MLRFDNQGQKIVETNFWDSDMARAGYAFVSWNAGAARLLLPDALASAVREMKSAKYVIVSRGRWVEAGRDDALELLFEDNSDNPYCLHLVSEQTDRLIPETNEGGGFWVVVWTRRGQQLRLPGKYRQVEALPCLQPWSEN
ncbi:MAG: hypothetical protein ABS76_22085 [Pelagibacterium sp. SCN 64-44]|nr:MAG: hypothetical protein ABS76_22085 [Pelagibacterium sp. SCN 64-44]